MHRFNCFFYLGCKHPHSPVQSYQNQAQRHLPRPRSPITDCSFPITQLPCFHCGTNPILRLSNWLVTNLIPTPGETHSAKAIELQSATQSLGKGGTQKASIRINVLPFISYVTLTSHA